MQLPAYRLADDSGHGNFCFRLYWYFADHAGQRMVAADKIIYS